VYKITRDGGNDNRISSPSGIYIYKFIVKNSDSEKILLKNKTKWFY
jgi:hypothetical protein